MPTAPAALTIVAHDPATNAWPREALATLLIDCVQAGASIGFLAPLSRDEANAFWDGVHADIGPDHPIWFGWLGDQLAGTVQLDRARRANGRHRAEVCKLMVSPVARRQGLARALMTAAEDQARRLGLQLLHLDTMAGSEAEPLYRGLGWRFSGQIPLFAGWPDGALGATAIYWKVL
ncbi:MAG: N-acetyltransferase family protein [Aquabacterium sp.]